jgi:DNA-binding beta-propeller fold protein YncE
VSDLYTGQHEVEGIALDPAAGQVYWGDGQGGGNGRVRVGGIDGAGPATTVQSVPAASVGGLAIDPAAGQAYWGSTLIGGGVRTGGLDGSPAAAPLYPGESASGVAIDPATGRIYWTGFDGPDGAIRVAPLNGSGPVSSLLTTDDSPTGVAIDPAGNRVYWAEFFFAQSSIRSAPLDGSGPTTVLYDLENSPDGVAIDPAAGKIYWAARGTGAIRVGNLDGSGTATTLYGATPAPSYLSLLRAPVGNGVPSISGTGELGQQLSCSNGAWAADLLGAHLYRAPRTFAYQWHRNGADISGATDPTYTPTEPGEYSCRVTATNQAGSASQTSAPRTVSTGPPPNQPPEISNFRIVPDDFFAIGRQTPLKGGTTIRFTLSEAATVRFRVRRDPPRKNGGPPPRHSHRFTRELEAGKQKVPFTGTLDGRTFPPGPYLMFARAIDAEGLSSQRESAPFRIKGR